MRAVMEFDYLFAYFLFGFLCYHICGLSREWFREARLLLVFGSHFIRRWVCRKMVPCS